MFGWSQLIWTLSQNRVVSYVKISCSIIIFVQSTRKVMSKSVIFRHCHISYEMCEINCWSDISHHVQTHLITSLSPLQISPSTVHIHKNKFDPHIPISYPLDIPISRIWGAIKIVVVDFPLRKYLLGNLLQFAIENGHRNSEFSY